jgi:putative Mn2+ efflux pump MntP
MTAVVLAIDSMPIVASFAMLDTNRLLSAAHLFFRLSLLGIFIKLKRP